MLDTILVIIVIALGLRYGWQAIQSLRISLGARWRVPRDASALGIPVPESMSKYTDELITLGFGRLGEAQVKLPKLSEPVTTWVFTSSDHTIMAEVTQPLVSFSTYYAEKRHEMTMYPIGERIRSKSFVVDFVESGVQDAFEVHLGRLRSGVQEFGSPSRFRTMDDYLRMETTWRRIIGSRLQRRFIIVDFATILAVLYSFALILIVALFSDWLALLAQGVFPRLRPLLILLIPSILVMIVRVIFNYRIALKLRRAA